jgi:hypothetical protein
MALFREDVSAYEKDKNLGSREFLFMKKDWLTRLKAIERFDSVQMVISDFDILRNEIYKLKSMFLRVRLTAFVNTLENHLLRRYMTSVDEDRLIGRGGFGKDGELTWQEAFDDLLKI